MTKIAFLLMAHRDPERLVAQAKALTTHGDCVAVHFDARAPRAAWDLIRRELGANPNVTFARRVKCGWGEYSLIQATLNLIRAARTRFQDLTHYYLISGDCYPTKSRGYIERYLADGKDTIEAHDFFESGWIKTGLKEERLIYRHWFNERGRKKWFYTSMELQKRFGLARDLPKGVSIQIGSQWWVLRAETIDRLIGFLKKRPDIPRFFRTTWIPDETFFQTLVAHLVPRDQIHCRPPTHLRFSDYGMPVVFHLDHADYLRAQPSLFARKLSPHAKDLHSLLLDRFTEAESSRPEGGPDSNLYAYLSDRGRKGRRYAPRFWEVAIGQRRQAELLIVASKLWHVGDAIESKIGEIAGVRQLGYLFDEDKDIEVPLGNLERGLAKRGRHRMALMNMVFDALDERRLVLCLDPSRAEAIDEFVAKIGDVRILLVDRPVSEAHIHSHALRTGLLAPDSGRFEQEEVMQALSHEFRHEIQHLREVHAGRLYENALTREREDNILAFGHFLRIPRAGAEALAREAEKHH